MAEKKTYADVLSGGKIGTYTEAPGGGTGSNKKFHVAHTQEEADEYRKNHPGEDVRVDQPRDEEGHFTYNAVNEKPLKYEPRGDTMVPFLKGINMTFAAKSGDRIVSNEGGKTLVYLNTLNFDVNSLAKAFQVFDLKKGFGQFSDEIKKKKGAASKFEKSQSGISIVDPQAMQQALKKAQTMYTGRIPSGFTKTPGAGTQGNPQSGAQSQPNSQPNSQPTQQNSQPNSQPNSQQGFMKPKTQPTQTQAAPKQEVKKFDIQQAKNDPKQFMKDNYAEIQKVEQIVTNKGYDLDVDELVKAIGSGQFKDFDDLINQIS